MADARRYEVMFVMNPALGDESIAAMVEKFKTLVEKNGTLDSIDEWGKRKLAYEINHVTEGYYVLMNITCGADFPAELDRMFKITEGVIRSGIMAK